MGRTTSHHSVQRQIPMMTSLSYPKVAIVSIAQSPMNPKRWIALLSCGHDFWLTSKSQPTKKTAHCTKCGQSNG